MRLYFLAVAVAVSGCGAAGSSSAPDVNGFDLLISSTYVRAYVQYVDVTGLPVTPPHVPDVGACAELETDTATVITTELASVAIDGLQLTNGSPYPDKQVSSPYTSSSGVTVDTLFHATDAGISITVPIHAGAYLAATGVHAQQQGTDVLATWSAPTADSVLVGDSGGYALRSCHRPPSSQFVIPDGGGQIVVQPLAAPEITDTELGPVRVFYGEIASTPIAPN